MRILRQKRSISSGELSLHLKEIGEAIIERKKKNIPHPTIANYLEYAFHYVFYFYKFLPPIADGNRPKVIAATLDAFYENPPHKEKGKFGRSLIKQYPRNDFFEREMTFLDNKIIKDLSKFLKDNDLDSRIEGCGDGKMTLSLKASEKNQIANFLAAWMVQFETPTAIDFSYEDLNLRTPSMAPPDRFNPNIKKEKITSMFL